MSTNWSVFVGFSASFEHDNKPTQEEMKQALLQTVGAMLIGQYEFHFEFDDPIEGLTSPIDDLTQQKHGKSYCREITLKTKDGE